MTTEEISNKRDQLRTLIDLVGAAGISLQWHNRKAVLVHPAHRSSVRKTGDESGELAKDLYETFESVAGKVCETGWPFSMMELFEHVGDLWLECQLSNLTGNPIVLDTSKAAYDYCAQFAENVVVLGVNSGKPIDVEKYEAQKANDPEAPKLPPSSEEMLRECLPFFIKGNTSDELFKHFVTKYGDERTSELVMLVTDVQRAVHEYKSIPPTLTQLEIAITMAWLGREGEERIHGKGSYDFSIKGIAELVVGPTLTDHRKKLFTGAPATSTPEPKKEGSSILENLEKLGAAAKKLGEAAGTMGKKNEPLSHGQAKTGYAQGQAKQDISEARQQATANYDPANTMAARIVTDAEKVQAQIDWLHERINNLTQQLANLSARMPNWQPLPQWPGAQPGLPVQPWPGQNGQPFPGDNGGLGGVWVGDLPNLYRTWSASQGLHVPDLTKVQHERK